MSKEIKKDNNKNADKKLIISNVSCSYIDVLGDMGLKNEIKIKNGVIKIWNNYN